MAPFLSRYPDRTTAPFLLQGFTDGFNFPCALSTVPPVVDNFHSAKLHPEVVSTKMAKEVSLGRMAGLFYFPPLADLVVSPLGVVPKKEFNKFRLIHHLLHA